MPKESFGTEGQILLHFSFRPVPQDETSLHQAFKFCWSAHPLPRLWPPGEHPPQPARGGYKSSPESQAGLP